MRNLKTTDVQEETSATTEMQRGHEKPRCRGTATQLWIAEKLDVKVSAPSGTTNHGLDTVEVSAPSKKKKRKTARVGGTGNTEAPASSKRMNWRWMNVKSESDTMLDHGIIRDKQS
jgi:hypothetical protein